MGGNVTRLDTSPSSLAASSCAYTASASIETMCIGTIAGGHFNELGSKAEIACSEWQIYMIGVLVRAEYDVGKRTYFAQPICLLPPPDVCVHPTGNKRLGALVTREVYCERAEQQDIH